MSHTPTVMHLHSSEPTFNLSDSSCILGKGATGGPAGAGKKPYRLSGTTPYFPRSLQCPLENQMGAKRSPRAKAKPLN